MALLKVSGDDFLEACQGSGLDKHIDREKRASDIATVMRFLDAGGDVERRHSIYAEHRSPLQQAAISGRVDVMQILLDRGADPNRPLRLATVLTTALTRSHIDAAKLLLSRSADPNLANLEGGKPIEVVATESAAVKLLLESGADASGGPGTKALVSAIVGNIAESARLLLAHGVSPDRIGLIDEAPLFVACFRGATDIVRLLLDHGADPDANGLLKAGHMRPDFHASSLYAACFYHSETGHARRNPASSVNAVRMFLGSCARIDRSTVNKLSLHPPGQHVYSETYDRSTVSSNAKPLQKLFLKHYTILVRLYAIGTPSTRLDDNRWLLEARRHAPLIASFLSPAPTRLALEFWAEHGEASVYPAPR